jgi:hypothetical protein
LTSKIKGGQQVGADYGDQLNNKFLKMKLHNNRPATPTIAPNYWVFLGKYTQDG